jgi:hypothetical protein
MEVEAMPKWEEKELFKEYCEDYNTGTLAHKKYYDYDAYMRAKAIKEAKKCGAAALCLLMCSCCVMPLNHCLPHSSELSVSWGAQGQQEGRRAYHVQ